MPNTELSMRDKETLMAKLASVIYDMPMERIRSGTSYCQKSDTLGILIQFLMPPTTDEECGEIIKGIEGEKKC